MRQKFEKIGRWLLLAVVAILAWGGYAPKGEAASYSWGLNTVEISGLSTTSGEITWTSGTISTSGAVDVYNFSISKAGFVYIAYQGWSIANSYVQLLNGDQTTSFNRKYVYTSSDTSPVTYTMQYALEAGSYCVKVWGYGSHTGDYRLGGLFAPANNTETESNNSFAQAMSLSAGKRVLGFLSVTDTVDFYRITVPSAQKIKFTYTAMIGYSYFQLWNGDYTEVKKQYVYTGSETAPKTYTYEETLSAGTYYVKIYPYNSNTGRYYLSWATESGVTYVSAISISGTTTLKEGKSTTLKATVSPSTATNTGVTWSSSNNSVATVSSTGKVTAKSEGTTVITATAEDGSGVSATCTITVTSSSSSNSNSSSSSTKVTSISISGYKRAAVGSTYTLKATVSPSNASNKKVTWKSGNKKIVTVSSKGKVKALRPGKTTITATAKDGSGVKKKITVIVVPKKMAKPSAASSTESALKITWKSQSNVSGYQVQYGTKSSFKGAKTKTVAKSKTSLQLKKATSGKKYYVRVRAYVKIGSKKYYGAWSAKKSVKVK